MGRLEGKVAIVTGAGIGIGQAIAKRFAAEGAHVWVTDINADTAEETTREIKASGGKATAMRVDVSKGQDLTALVRAVTSEHGLADVLVNNAGILVRGEVRTLTDEEWTRLREVNLDGVLRLSRDCLPLLRKSGAPSIINISSIMANRGLRPLAAYTATKGAVTALTKGLAVEYAPFNIRVNTIAPGYIETAITDHQTMRNAQQLAVGELVARAQITIIQQHVVTGGGQLLIDALGCLADTHGLVGVHRHDGDLEGRDGFRQHDAALVVALLDGSGDHAGHADAVAAHGQRLRLAVLVEHGGVHGFGVLGAELEDVTHLDTACDVDHALAVR